MSELRLILLITRREVIERLRLRSFRIFTIAILLLTGGGIVAIDRLPDLLSGGPTDLGLVAPAPGLSEALTQSAGLQDFDLELIDYNSRADAEAALTAGEIDAYLQNGNLVFDKDEDASLAAVVNRAVYQLQLPDLLAELGLTADQAARLLNPQPTQVEVKNPEPAQEQQDQDERRVLASIATIALYIVMALYGNWILVGVVEEKSSRVVEVLLGLVQPHDLLAGKTLGILVAALIQLAAGIAGGLAGLAMIGSTSLLPDATPDVVVAGGVFLIFGLVLYSLMFAVVGSTVGRQSEAQSAAMPVTLLLLVPYMLSLIYVPEQPDSTLSRVLSVLPVTSPLVMPTRVAVGSPSVFELAGAVILLALLIAGVAWIGGRVYAGAILVNRQVNLLQVLRSVGLRRA